MENQENYFAYKWDVFKKLRQRNEDERIEYGEVFHTINKQYDKIDMLHLENKKLTKSNEKLQSNSDLGSFKPGTKSILKKFRRQNRDLSQQSVNLKAALDEKERQMKEKETEFQKLKASNTEIENQYKLIKEEHAALQVAFSQLEILRMEEQKQKVTEKIQLKADEPEPMQSKEEILMREKEIELEKELEEVAKTPVVIETNEAPSLTCLNPVVTKKNGHKNFVVHESEVNAVVWTHTGSKFATAGSDHNVKIWDMSLGQPYLKGVTSESKSTILSLDFDPEETLIVAASYDGCSRVWNLLDMRRTNTLSGHKNRVMSAKFLGEPGKVVSGSSDGTLRIWDLQRRLSIITVDTKSGVNDVVRSYGFGTNIVSGHCNKKIRFWDVRSESRSKGEILLEGQITSLDLCPDGYSLLCSVRDENYLQLIDFRKNQVMRTFRSYGFYIGCNWTRAKFSPDGKFCICGSQDGGIYVWNVSTGALEKVLKEHSSTVVACAWSWCGSYLLSCDKTGNAILRFEP